MVLCLREKTGHEQLDWWSVNDQRCLKRGPFSEKAYRYPYLTQPAISRGNILLTQWEHRYITVISIEITLQALQRKLLFIQRKLFLSLLPTFVRPPLPFTPPVSEVQ